MEQINKYYPEDIYILLLQYLKKNATDLNGEEINNIILSVPSDFNEKQKEIIKKAAENKGFNISKIILNLLLRLFHIFINIYQIKKNVLIYSMNSYYTNIIILTIEKNIFTTLVSINNNLGKNDFIQRLLEYCIDDFNEKTDINLRLDKYHKGIIRLKREIENYCLNDLTFRNQCVIDIDGLADGEDLFMQIFRRTFEELCEDLFKQIIINIKNALEKSKLNKFEMTISYLKVIVIMIKLER